MEVNHRTVVATAPRLQSLPHVRAPRATRGATRQPGAALRCDTVSMLVVIRQKREAGIGPPRFRSNEKNP